MVENLEKEKEREMEKVIRLTLIRVGIKCDHSGFTFLVQAIKEVILQHNLITNLRNLFTIVAQECGAKDYFRVEANIHNSITYAYKNKGFGFINTIYGMEVLKPDHKPTTAEFINLIVQYYLLGLYENDYEYQPSQEMSGNKEVAEETEPTPA